MTCENQDLSSLSRNELLRHLNHHEEQAKKHNNQGQILDTAIFEAPMGIMGTSLSRQDQDRLDAIRRVLYPRPPILYRPTTISQEVEPNNKPPKRSRNILQRIIDQLIPPA